MLALELFEVGGRLLANEIAPRVHNSGHWTIEGAATSQFENHLRAILGLPLGSTEALARAVMVNLIGGVPRARRCSRVPGAHLHLYGKEPRPGRKLGHVTLVEPGSAASIAWSRRGRRLAVDSAVAIAGAAVDEPAARMGNGAGAASARASLLAARRRHRPADRAARRRELGSSAMPLYRQRRHRKRRSALRGGVVPARLGVGHEDAR